MNQNARWNSEKFPPRHLHLVVTENFTSWRYFVIASNIYQFPFLRNTKFCNLNKSRVAVAVFDEFVWNKTRFKKPHAPKYVTLYSRNVDKYGNGNQKIVRLISFTNFNAQFHLFINNMYLHYNPRHVSSINMPIFRRTNCIITASGIVTLCKRLYSIESDDTRCCDNTIFPPEDGNVNARNMSRIIK